MKRKVIITGDGSKTIHIEDWNEQYHSKHGAIKEAQHVFLKNGLLHYHDLYPKKDSVSILEIGFGTGLNTFLSVLESQRLNINIDYIGVEAYPVAFDEVMQLNYAQEIDETKGNVFQNLHQSPWEESITITSNFNLIKRQQFFKDIKEEKAYDIIYFDAFGARVQPELWTKEIFEIMYKALKSKGILVTYAAIGQVKRDMQALGFAVERLSGPPGKRHMLRASK